MVHVDRKGQKKADHAYTAGRGEGAFYAPGGMNARRKQLSPIECLSVSFLGSHEIWPYDL